jgi:cyclic-di-GMP phosphodiesterase TipF (flagellum assembly factor)
VIAAAVAVFIPQYVPKIGQDAAIVIGGVVLIGSALLHEVLSRQEGESRLAGALGHLREELGSSRAALEAAEAEIASLKGEIETLRDKGAGSASKRNVDSVIAEVKVLQGLIEQLSAVPASDEAQAAADDAGQAAAEDAAQAAAGGSARAVAGGGMARPEVSFAIPANKKVTIVGPSGPVRSAQSSAVPLRAQDGKVIMPVGGVLDDESILSIVRDGLEQNRVDLVLQPVVRLPQRKRAYYEAFTRIRDARGAMLVPEQYIGIAEREGLVATIDNMLLFRCVQLVRRTRERNPNLGFFCNISAHSLTDRHFFSNFVEFMADNTALAPNLIFEFPYATIANRDQEIERHLAELAKFGFRFSVDQVSGLNVDYDDLMRLHFKFVKIEAQILLDEVRNPTGPIAVEDIKRVIDRHGIDLVAEKIETEADLLELLDLRIDFGQGYLFGEPRLAKSE